MKFQIKHGAFVAACLLIIGLLLSGCNTEMTQCPASIRVVANEDNSFSLSWEPVENVSRYRIYRRLSGSPDFKFVADTQATEYTDFPLEPKRNYDYQVTALGPQGESDGAVFLAEGPEKPVTLSSPKIASVTRLDIATNVISP